jgi:hypothetical protein
MYGYPYVIGLVYLISGKVLYFWETTFVMVANSALEIAGVIYFA